MNNDNFNEAMKYFFDKLEINEIPFKYDEQLKWLITTETFPYDDLFEYYLVVKLNDTHTCGTVVIGFSDGIKFYEVQTLGQILYENNKWQTL